MYELKDRINIPNNEVNNSVIREINIENSYNYMFLISIGQKKESNYVIPEVSIQLNWCNTFDYGVEKKITGEWLKESLNFDFGRTLDSLVLFDQLAILHCFDSICVIKCTKEEMVLDEEITSIILSEFNYPEELVIKTDFEFIPEKDMPVPPPKSRAFEHSNIACMVSKTRK